MIFKVCISLFLLLVGGFILVVGVLAAANHDQLLRIRGFCWSMVGSIVLIVGALGYLLTAYLR